MTNVYEIDLNEKEAIRYYANKFVEDALEDCSEFNYCLYIDQNYEHKEFIINHKEQILDRIKKDERVADVYIDDKDEDLSFDMVFWIDYCPYYYEEHDLSPDIERAFLRTFIIKELQPLETSRNTTTTRNIIMHFMDSYIEKATRLDDDTKDGVYYSIKEHICNTGFNEKYIDKYEVYVDKNNIKELIKGLENEIDKLYIKEPTDVKLISYYNFLEILNKYNKQVKFNENDLGKFITKENNIYLAINNEAGEMKMEDFDNIEDCLKFLDIEDLDKSMLQNREEIEPDESEEL